MRLSCPSPLPTVCSTGRFAVGTVSPEVPGWLAPAPDELEDPVLAVPDPLPLPLPLHAASVTASAATPSATAERGHPLVAFAVRIILIASRPPQTPRLLGRGHLARNGICL